MVVLWFTYEGLGHAGYPELLGVAQVDELVDEPRLPLLDYHVLWLQVPVDDTPANYLVFNKFCSFS